MPRPPKQAEGGGREAAASALYITWPATNSVRPSVGASSAPFPVQICDRSCNTHTNGRRERRTTSDRSNQGADFYLRQKCSQVCKFVKSPRKITSQGRKQPPSQRLWNLLSPILRERHLLHSQSSLVSRYALTS